MTEQSAIPIYTIGYGDRSIDDFIAVLQRYQIDYVVDVRTAPYSRYKPDFSKTELSAALREGGIKYLFMGDQLGGRPTDPACYTDGKVDYAKVKLTDAYRQGIERIGTAFAQQQRIALMCSEGKPEQCHRSKLIGETLTQLAIPLIHIDEADAAQSQEAVIARLTDGQLSLFDDHAFHSRKRYQPHRRDPNATEAHENDDYSDNHDDA
ncbi:MAG: DUF488 domain-containing protein [Caldilineaceae bacterium]